MGETFSFAAFFWFLAAGMPADLLSFLEPKSALEALGESTGEADLRRLIEGKAAAPGDGDAAALDEKAVQTAIQNLASASEAVKAKAREKLASLGEAVRARIEDVAKTDERRAVEAKKVLQELDAAAKASVSRSRVARMLAVRLAGDREMKALAGPLRELSATAEPHLKRAAAEALARIEGKDPPPPPERPWAQSLAAIVALPAQTNYLIDFPVGTALAAAGSEGPPRIDRVLGQFAGMMGPAGGGIIEQATRGILDFAVKCGNVRVDRITLANVGAVARKAGLALIVCGEYDSALLEKGIQEFGFSRAEEVRGKKVLASREVRIVLLDEHRVLLLFGDASENFPFEEYLAACTAGSRPLAGVARWGKFLGTLGGAARALIIMDAALTGDGEAFRGLEREGHGPEILAALKGMREIEGDAKAGDSKKIGFRLEAAFEEAKHATDLAAFLRGKVDERTSELERELAGAPGEPFEGMMKTTIEAMRSIRVVGEGKKGILRGELDPGALLPMLIRTVRVPAFEHDDF